MNRIRAIFLRTACITCLGMLAGPSPAGEDAAKVIAEARQLFDQAVALQGGWTSTQSLLQTAEKELRSDPAAALRAATQAREEARLSLERARVLRDAWAVPPYLSGK